MTELEKFLNSGGKEYLRKYALMLTNDNLEDAEDLINTTLAEAIEGAKRCKTNYRGWIVSLLHNQYAYLCRNATMQKNTEEGFSYWLGSPTYEPNLEPDEEPEYYRLSFKEILGRFKPMERAVLCWLYMQNRPVLKVMHLVERCYGRTFSRGGFDLYTFRLRERARKLLTASDDSTSSPHTTGKTSPSTRLAA